MLYITAKDRDEAYAIAKTVVKERLAACANIFPATESIFWWADELEEVNEATLLLKTQTDLVPLLIQRVKELHSYNAPDIVALPIIAGNEAYLHWIQTETISPHRLPDAKL